jgi:hypothetical protein
MYDTLIKTGSFTTRSILFDTGSDRIRPESTPTLTEMLATLKEHASLKILIEATRTTLATTPATRRCRSGGREPSCST